MLCIKTKNSFLYKRQEIWFYNNEQIEFTDNDLFYQSFVLPSFMVQNTKEYATHIIDLNKSEEYIFTQFRSTYKNYIRRTEKMNFEYKYLLKPNIPEVKSYIDSYKNFSLNKGNQGLLDYNRITKLVENNCFIITTSFLDTKEIIYHSYIADAKERVRLLYSHHNVSFVDEQIRSCVSKMHHWKDILLFKSLGYKIYDLGGVDSVNTPGIAHFKTGFGGEPEKSFFFQKTAGIYGFINRIKSNK